MAETTSIDWSAHVYYDDTSPTGIRWNKDIYGGHRHEQKVVQKGDIAGTLSSGRYYVRISGLPRIISRIIFELHYGKLPKGVVVDHIDGNPLNNVLSNLRGVPSVINSQNAKMPVTNKSGVTGVRKHTQTYKGNKSQHWVASWNGLDGKAKCKSFACRKFGEDEAFRLACAARKHAIEDLNSQGAGYTERHGNT